MKYSEINIGDKASLDHVITKNDLEKFVELTGDDNRLHVDAEFAATTSFRKPVVHGMLGASFISTIIGTKIPGDGALWFSQNLEFLLPVRMGDELHIVAEVMKKNDREHIIELKTDIYNQNRQIVTKGYSKVKVIEQQSIEPTVIPQKQIPSALVIGGTGGIGSATCVELAKQGFNVAIHYNKNLKQAEDIKTQIEQTGQKAFIVQADILHPSQIATMVEKTKRALGRIDALINCSALPIPNIKVDDLQWSDFLKQLELNVKSTFEIIQAVLPIMKEQAYGKIINLGSSSYDKPNNEWAHYIAAKGALSGLTRAFAMERAPKGIRVNMVTPSMVDTLLTVDIPEKIKLITAAQTPLKRLATVQDVAGVICFLAGASSDYLTGENIRLNGGQIMI
jgi:3-oxoacyl-[acyl-carrier protein] reductase